MDGLEDFKERALKEKKALFDELKELNSIRRKVRYVVKTHTRWVDNTLIELFLRIRLPKEKVSVVAVGGYGRRQLNPHSDIDLMLIPDKIGLDDVVRGIYDFLYGLGYECSVAVRGIDECIEYAQKDDTIKTSFVDSRFIWGNVNLYHNFEKTLKEKILPYNVEDFIQAKIEYLKQLHSKYGNTVFVLEPNVKEGVGSLRDYHVLLWISKALFGVKNAIEMQRIGLLSSEDYSKLRDALYFLWQMRNALHFNANKKNDVLFLDLRRKIALNMGFNDSTRFSAEDRLMRRYYYNAKNLSRVVDHTLEGFLKKSSPTFVFLDDRIKINEKLDAERFDDVSCVLEAFYYSALYGLTLTAKSLAKAKETFSNLSKHKSDYLLAFLFRQLFSLNKDISQAVRQMHEVAFLDRYIPEFGNVCCLSENSLYHKYTVDEHSIQSLANLEELFSYDVPRTFVMRLSYIWKNLSPHDRFVLRLAALLHDIGKIEKSKHEIVGAKLVSTIADRLHLGPYLKEKLVFLVRHHLLISRIISTLDVDDPKTIEDFLKIVDKKDKLNLLVLLTYADMKAVNDNVWTGWKESLIETLYLKATYTFENRDYDEFLKINAKASREKIKAMLGKCYHELIDTFPDNIFNDIDDSTMVKYIKDIKDTSKSVFAYKDDKTSTVKIVVYYKNIFGIFNKISGVLACQDINIITAKSYNLNNSMIVDVFNVNLKDGSVDADSIQKMLHEVLNNEFDLDRCMDSKRNKFLSRLERAKLEMSLQQVDVKVDNSVSDLYTVIRIYAPDRVGLVYYITKVFAEFKLQVGMFILDTKGNMAVDTFYVVSEGFKKIYSPKLLELIKSKLYEVLA
ncbi:[protein-PII] uridylyltransferase [Hippea maritima]|uniref:Bifunctional uridylyltransferase/uridylyl-removing enzyme n=1 Tax=Hippea maritima (strain ATCC 700847 / DSM 10411 / MH2) TaxID=760142 RepID=F2LTS6_HIPMA|nr:[protein-PII] uridylyltransferase [Hippea maritima]AEA34452.1 UTP-GlnB uridylyltransferase, GlnD [Hippea maritima DSM 10411]